MLTPLEQMREALEKRRAVVVVGTGVSIMATDGAECASWAGLLKQGANYCTDRGWIDAKKRTAFDSLMAAGEVVLAAGMVRKAFGTRMFEFEQWLDGTVGALMPTHPEVLDCIHGLSAPLITLNYDQLLERTCPMRSEAITWRQGYQCLQFMNGKAPAKILHLHGYYKSPESVVLDIASYDTIVNDQFAEAFRNAISMTRSIIYVGCGGTFEDPHFEAFRAWASNELKGYTQSHYRLVREEEFEDAQRLHASDRITPIVYGKDYSELPAFLRGLAPASVELKSSVIAAPPPLRLPPAPLTFGRDEEIKALVGAMLSQSGRPVCVTGGPGFGKSNLCLAALHNTDVEARFGPRRFFVRLDGSATLSDMATAIANAMGVVAVASQSIDDVVLNELAREPVALALDNIETPWEPTDQRVAVEEFLARMISIKHVLLVATIRGVEQPGRLAWLEPIPHLDPLAGDAAREMFLSVAPEHDKDQDLEELLVELAGWPLAINLMAHQSRGAGSITRVLERWRTEKTKMLKRGVASDRLDNLHVSIDCSLNSPRMTDEAKRLWRCIAELPEGSATGDLAHIGFSSTGVHTLEQLLSRW